MDVSRSVLTMNCEGDKSELHVSEFYRDAVVLITGGTGYLGKVLVEKLLRSFAVKKIVLLVREKRGMGVAERLCQLVSDPIFNTIRGSKVHPNKVFEKLHAVEVNFSAEEFLKEPDKTNLLNEAQIVFHNMATTRFSIGLKNILDTNVTSAQKLYAFLRQAPQLRAIVHVSTFYANCDRSHIEECVYDDIRYGGWENIQRILDPLTESEMANLMPSIIAPLPNNYTFSKKCAEVMVQDRFSDLPIGIFRPPIVTPSYREPVPGWVDAIQGVTGLCIPVVKQRLLWYYGDPDACPALTPVDYCISGMITAACDINMQNATKREPQPTKQCVPSLPVYNFYFNKNLISRRQFKRHIGASLSTTTGRLLSTVRTRVTRWRILSQLTLWWMYLLAYIKDFFLTIVGKSACNVRMVRGLSTLADVVEPFRCSTWTARNDNVRRMRQLLTKTDEAVLEFDVDRVDLTEYYKNFAVGLLEMLRRMKLKKRENRNVVC